MTKFNTGDRVLLNSSVNHPVRNGSVGTVAELSSIPFVAWDGFTGGHSGGLRDDSTNHWAVMEEELELAPLTKFAIGTRVTVNGTHDGVTFENREGVVVESDIEPSTLIRFDERFHDQLHSGATLSGEEVDRRHFYFGRGDGDFTIQHSTHLNGLDLAFSPPPATDASRPRFMTAWKDGPEFSLTGDNAFNTQRDADNHANELAATHADTTIVVLKVVSQHSSRIVVTSEVT